MDSDRVLRSDPRSSGSFDPDHQTEVPSALLSLGKLRVAGLHLYINILLPERPTWLGDQEYGNKYHGNTQFH